MEHDRPFITDLGVSLAVGFGLALVYLHFMGGWLGAWTAGIVATVTVLLLTRIRWPHSDLVAFFLFLVGGAIGGVAWWVVAEALASLWELAGSGAAFVAILYVFEVVLPAPFGK